MVNSLNIAFYLQIENFTNNIFDVKVSVGLNHIGCTFIHIIAFLKTIIFCKKS